MSYWEDQKSQEDFKSYLDFYEGCLHCGCDHGCNGWLKENETKTALLLRILANPKSTTKLEKVTKMLPKRADVIWYKIKSWEAQKFNRELRNDRKGKI